MTVNEVQDLAGSAAPSGNPANTIQADSQAPHPVPETTTSPQSVHHEQTITADGNSSPNNAHSSASKRGNKNDAASAEGQTGVVLGGLAAAVLVVVVAALVGMFLLIHRKRSSSSAVPRPEQASVRFCLALVLPLYSIAFFCLFVGKVPYPVSVSLLLIALGHQYVVTFECSVTCSLQHATACYRLKAKSWARTRMASRLQS
jgi:hypothetical protein